MDALTRGGVCHAIDAFALSLEAEYGEDDPELHDLVVALFQVSRGARLGRAAWLRRCLARAHAALAGAAGEGPGPRRPGCEPIDATGSDRAAALLAALLGVREER